jgi:hypothetical protein
MTTSTATLVHSSSREADNALRIARVAAAGRVQAARIRAEHDRAVLVEQAYKYAESHGQIYAVDPWDVDWCLVCGRPTDHFGEHSESQIRAWRAGTDIRIAS